MWVALGNYTNEYIQVLTILYFANLLPDQRCMLVCTNKNFQVSELVRLPTYLLTTYPHNLIIFIN